MDAELSQLLQALAASVRAVQPLPEVNTDETSEEEEDASFDYLTSFPEVQQALQQAVAAVSQLCSNVVDVSVASSSLLPLEEDDNDDPAVLWERVAELCETLIEQVEAYLEQQPEAPAPENAAQWRQAASTLRGAAQNKAQQVVQNTVDMEKPQVTYRMTISNGRNDPFVPPVPDPSQPKPFGLTAEWNLELQRDAETGILYVPHPYQVELEQWKPQPWQLEPPAPAVPSPTKDGPLSATWMDTPADLQALGRKMMSLSTESDYDKYVAIDLEAHSYRSFSGLTCLVQVSLRKRAATTDPWIMENYLIDALALRQHIHAALQPVFANPDLVKVLHGAQHDVLWLQRDFGCYVVNLLDTGQMARALQLESASYVYALRKYCPDASTNKQHQLADWRVRPLSPEMQQYAIADTHYLLDVCDGLLRDVHQHADVTVEQVYDRSRQVALSLYKQRTPVFNAQGYQDKLQRHQRRQRRTTLAQNPVNEPVLAALWDWRDATAREQDESLQYVCTDADLMRMATSCPTTVDSLQRLVGSLSNRPPPPLVLQCAQDVANRIRQAQQHSAGLVGGAGGPATDDDEAADNEVARQAAAVGAPSSAFFKPAAINTGISLGSGGRRAALNDPAAVRGQQGRGPMSPVLGTAALYEQAGWMTPQHQRQYTDPDDEDDEDGPGDEEQVDEEERKGLVVVDVTTTTTEDDDPPERGGKPRRYLSVHASNKDYRSKEHDKDDTAGPATTRTADGMGTVRAARDSSQSPLTSSVEDDVKAAQKSSSALLRNSGLLLSQPKATLLGMVSGKSATVEVDKAETAGGDDEGGELEEEEFVIPRSMKEIYQISNRNRRNKKAGSPTPERGVTPTNEKEREELADAEALLREKGLIGYFDEIPSGKRPRTKSRTGRESEESVPQDSSNAASKEDDIAFMTEIGWIAGSKEVEELSRIRTEAELEEGVGGPTDAKAKQASRDAGAYDYSASGVVGAMHPTATASNPFFAGAAMTGGPLAQAQFAPGVKSDTSSSRGGSKKGKGRHSGRRQQERPEKKDGRTHAYRKR